ncbi:MAG TPA: SRPBCC family protein [Tepidisphaeraceae bacterium]|jgi:uncharacterized membrane protein
MSNANPSITRAASLAADDVFSAQSSLSPIPVKASRASGSSKAGSSSVNVGGLERNFSIAAGAALGLLALTKPISLRGLVLAGASAGLLYRGATGQCGMYKQLGISTNDKDANAPSAKPAEYNNRSIHVEQSVHIERSASQLYTFWRNFENLPQIMDHLKEVKVLDEKKSRWVAKAPLGFSVEWDAQIINDEPNHTIAWQSIGNATVDNSGSVRFIERDGGTDVNVVIDYIPPAGRVGAMVAKLFGEEPNTQVADDLQRFKKIMEGSQA